MPRAIPDMQSRTLHLETGKRAIDLPVDGSGHVRRLAKLDRKACTRSATPSDPIGFDGHAALFNNRTWIGGKRWGFWEEIAPGAFAKTITEADVRMLLNHDPNFLLARNKSGTLRLSEDTAGLAVDADMAPVSYALDLAVLLDRGDLNQMSFAFDMISYEWTELEDGSELLRHLEVSLWDVAPVTYPAYADTDAGLRMDLLAAARANGFDAIDISQLGKRLADPDPDLIAVLRNVAHGVRMAPAETTPAVSPPAETTDARTTNTRDLAGDTLSARTQLAKELISQ